MRERKRNFNELVDWMKSQGPVLVCFSGGMDSGLLAHAARLSGAPHACLMGVSEIRSGRATSRARALARALEVALLEILTSEISDPAFRANGPDRCYLCKCALFSAARKVARERGLKTIVDGTNVSDLSDVRPGMQAAQELGVRSPYLELGWSKEDIRSAARALNLPLPESPTTCLATRFFEGIPIDPSLFPVIDDVEQQLESLGFSMVRARVTDTGLRLEVAPEEVPRLHSALSLLRYPEGYIIDIAPEGYRPSGSRKAR